MGDESSPPFAKKQKSKSGAEDKKPASKSKVKPKSKAEIVESDSEPEPMPVKGKKGKKVAAESDSDVPPLVKETKQKLKVDKDNDSSPPPAPKSSRKRKPEVVEEKPKTKKPRASTKSKAAVESEPEGDDKVSPKSGGKTNSPKKAKKGPAPPADVMDIDSDPESERSNDEDKVEESDSPPKQTKKKSGTRKRKSLVVVFKSREFIEDSDDENEALNAPPTASTSKPALAKATTTPVKSKTKSKPKSKKKDSAPDGDDSGQRSESEVDVLLDQKSSPIKEKEKGKVERGKGRTEDKEAKPKKPRGGKELSKDEEAIKRLKSFVVACGVRKQWVKEFKDKPTPSQQIAHLRSILTELGMNSRPSLEQARAIKIRRELAQEIEDVKEFDAVVNAPRRSRAAAPRHSLAEAGGPADAKSDEEEGSPEPRRKRPSFNFLDDQSSDGD